MCIKGILIVICVIIKIHFKRRMQLNLNFLCLFYHSLLYTDHSLTVSRLTTKYTQPLQANCCFKDFHPILHIKAISIVICVII